MSIRKFKIVVVICLVIIIGMCLTDRDCSRYEDIFNQINYIEIINENNEKISFEDKKNINHIIDVMQKIEYNEGADISHINKFTYNIQCYNNREKEELLVKLNINCNYRKNNQEKLIEILDDYFSIDRDS